MLQIEIPKKTDIQMLVQANTNWQHQVVRDQVRNGFLSAAFSSDTFKTIIELGEIVVAKMNDSFAGYYLINNSTRDGVLSTHASKVKELKNNGTLKHDDSIGLGAQALVEAAFQGQGIREAMLKKLAQFNQDKYDYFFSTISKKNPRAFRAHTKDGWYVVDEDELKYFVLFDLSSKRRL